MGNNTISSKLPSWIKNPWVLIASVIMIILMSYVGVNFHRSGQSPFTEYKPLPIDSSFLGIDSNTQVMHNDTLLPIIDTSALTLDGNRNNADTSDLAHLFRLNTDYAELDPNEQLNKIEREESNDLFSQLVLANLDPNGIELLGDIEFKFGIKPYVHIMSTTAVEILSEASTRYHLDILQALEQSSSIHDLFIVDRKGQVAYATNRKYMKKYLLEIFPGQTMTDNKMMIMSINGITYISQPVYHHYGKIGSVILAIKN